MLLKVLPFFLCDVDVDVDVDVDGDVDEFAYGNGLTIFTTTEPGETFFNPLSIHYNVQIHQ